MDKKYKLTKMTKNIKEIKNIFYDLLILGEKIEEPELSILLSILYDKSFEACYDNVHINGLVFFVEKSRHYFLNAKKFKDKKDIDKEIDDFIEYYKKLLVKENAFEILNCLRL